MDLLTQAKEDLQRERMMSLLKTLMPWAAGVLLIVLLGVGGREAYEAYQNHVYKQRTDVYLAASNAGSLDALIKVAKDDNSERGVMAALTVFARMSPAEQENKGIALLQETISNTSLPNDWRALASVILVKAEIAFGAQAAKADALLALLKPALDDKVNPWHALSAMQAALIAGEMKQDPKAALSFIEGLNKEKLSPQLAGEIGKLRTRYGTLVAKEK